MLSLYHFFVPRNPHHLNPVSVIPGISSTSPLHTPPRRLCCQMPAVKARCQTELGTPEVGRLRDHLLGFLGRSRPVWESPAVRVRSAEVWVLSFLSFLNFTQIQCIWKVFGVSHLLLCPFKVS